MPDLGQKDANVIRLRSWYEDQDVRRSNTELTDEGPQGDPAARSGPRLVPRVLALLAGYENPLAAPLFALARQCKAEVTVAAPGGSP
jgi:hypothetical protein